MKCDNVRTIESMKQVILAAMPVLTLILANGIGGKVQARQDPSPQPDSVRQMVTLAGQESPPWAEGLVLFGIVSIDGMQTAYFGEASRQTVIAMAPGEKLRTGIELVAVYEYDPLGTISAALRLDNETAIISSAGDAISISSPPLIVEPAPTSHSLPPTRVPLVFSEIVANPKQETSPESGTETHSLPENDRPAVVAWPRKLAN